MTLILWLKKLLNRFNENYNKKVYSKKIFDLYLSNIKLLKVKELYSQLYNHIITNWFYWGLVSIFLLSLFLRIYRLDYYNLSQDESLNWNVTNRSVAELIQATKLDIHPPLYTILLHYWTQLFGYSESALRSLSLIFGLLTVYGIYLLAKQLFTSKKLILLSVAFAGVNPLLVLSSQEARSYSLMTFLIIILIYSIIKIQRTSELHWSITFVIVSCLGLYSHNLFIVILIALFLYQIYFILRKSVFNNSLAKSNQINPQHSTQSYNICFIDIVHLLFTYLFITLIYSPWLYIFLNQIKTTDNKLWLTFNPIKDLVNNTSSFFTSQSYNADLPHLSPIFKYYLEFFSTIMVFLGISEEIRHRKLNFSILLVCLLGVSYLASFRTPIYYIGYLVFALPVLTIILATGHNTLSSILSKKIATTLSCLFIIFSSLFIVTNIQDNPYRGGFKEVVLYLKDKKAEIVLHPTPSTTWNSFKYYNLLTKSNLSSFIYSPARNEPNSLKGVISNNEYYNKGTLIQGTSFWSITEWENTKFTSMIKDQGFCQTQIKDFLENIRATHWKKC
jgi:mannosyltransferase